MGFPLYARSGGFIQALSLEKGKGYFPVQQSVLGQVDFLLAALAEETLNLVTVVGEGVGWLEVVSEVGGESEVVGLGVAGGVEPPTARSAAAK